MESKNELLSTQENGVQILKINRIKRKNALNTNLYSKISETLNAAAKDDNVKMTVLTSVGDFFSSGFDFKEAMENGGIRGGSLNKLRDLIASVINYPKLLIAVVNGPAIGLGCTLLALCDLVYAVEDTYFLTPFSKLGLTAEGCSSYTFPKIFGTSKAGQLLYLSEKLTAKEALQFGFITELITKQELKDNIWKRIFKFTELSIPSMNATKLNFRATDRGILHEANIREIDALRIRMEAPETIEFMLKAFKNKL